MPMNVILLFEFSLYSKARQLNTAMLFFILFIIIIYFLLLLYFPLRIDPPDHLPNSKLALYHLKILYGHHQHLSILFCVRSTMIIISIHLFISTYYHSHYHYLFIIYLFSINILNHFYLIPK